MRVIGQLENWGDDIVDLMDNEPLTWNAVLGERASIYEERPSLHNIADKSIAFGHAIKGMLQHKIYLCEKTEIYKMNLSLWVLYFHRTPNKYLYP